MLKHTFKRWPPRIRARCPVHEQGKSHPMSDGGAAGPAQPPRARHRQMTGVAFQKPRNTPRARECKKSLFFCKPLETEGVAKRSAEDLDLAKMCGLNRWNRSAQPWDRPP